MNLLNINEEKSNKFERDIHEFCPGFWGMHSLILFQ